MITTESQREEIQGWVKEWRKIRRRARSVPGVPLVASVATDAVSGLSSRNDATTGLAGPSPGASYCPGRGRPKTGQYRGVTPIRGRFRVQISIGNGHNKHIGTFDSEVQAAMAWDRAAIELRGDRAVLNFPRERDAC
jgi:EREBP-like factor